MRVILKVGVLSDVGRSNKDGSGGRVRWSDSMLEDPGMLDCGLVVVEDGGGWSPEAPARPTTTHR